MHWQTMLETAFTETYLDNWMTLMANLTNLSLELSTHTFGELLHLKKQQCNQSHNLVNISGFYIL